MTTATDVMCDTLPKLSRIHQFRDSLLSGGQIDGYEIDPFLAEIICSVHDACQKSSNREALMKLPIPELVCVCIQMVR